MTSNDLLGNLSDYDLSELLLTLAASGRDHLFEVRHPDGTFRLGLSGDRLTGADFGIFSGVDALAALVTQPEGSFAVHSGHDLVGRTLPGGGPDLPLVAALLAALRLGPPFEPKFTGAARVEGQPDLMALDAAERHVLSVVRAGRGLDALETGEERFAAARLAQVGLIAPRKLRVARLTVGVWKDGRPGATVDTTIYTTWTQQLGRSPKFVQIRDDAGVTLTLRLHVVANVGTQLLLTPDMLVRHGLRGGVTVLARPADTDQP